MPKIDETDFRILRAMQEDGARTVTEIAERVGISQSPCSRRILQLQADGVIVGKQVNLNRRKLGFNTVVDTRIKLKEHGRVPLEKFKKELREIPEIQSAVLMMGDFDFHVRLVVRDIDHYQALLQDRLTNLPGVQELQSTVIVEVVKNTLALPI